MATSEEIRQWAREQGYEVADRGKVSAALRAEYAQSVLGESPGSPEPEPIMISDDDSSEAAGGEPSEPPEVAAETRPRRPRRDGPPRGRVFRALFDPPKQGQNKRRKPGGKPKPRVSLEKMTSRIYTRAGQMISAFAPATGRCMMYQSPMAGVLLEDVAKNTIADRLMQPVARAEDKVDKLFALAAPPVLVLALETTDPSNVMRRQLLVGLLREALLISMEVTEQFIDQIEKRALATARNEEAVDRLLSFILNGPPQPGQQDDLREPQMAGAAA